MWGRLFMEMGAEKSIRVWVCVGVGIGDMDGIV